MSSLSGFFFFFFLPHRVACGISDLWPGMELRASKQSPNHWTTAEVPVSHYLPLKLSLVFCSLTVMWLEKMNSSSSFSRRCFLYLENGFIHRFWETLSCLSLQVLHLIHSLYSLFPELLIGLRWVLPNRWLFFLNVPFLSLCDTLKTIFNSLLSLFISTV